jgi:dTDP-4-dehydrorhamnose 3,5-epimerase/CDP-3, 6-dideoxy-D-glycero-D-glycero-4-hexulose-5-epimerase
MKIEDTFIPGLKLIHLNKFTDTRGSFLKVFNEDFFVANGLETTFKESYYSVSHKNVIRGMHFQIPPAEHTKLVYLNSGSIVDVILDIRKSSPTYGQYFSIHINCDEPILVYIPIGCAHGFLSLEDHTMVTYMQTSCYNKDCDMGIKYNSFGMAWGIENPVVSDRDLRFPDFIHSNYDF